MDGMETGMVDSTQMQMSIAMTKKSLDFEASMTASLINGTIQKGADMDARLAGLAAEGIGSKLNITV